MAHNINNVPGESIYKLCKVVGSPLPSGRKVSRALYQEQKKTNSHKYRKNARHYIESRSKRQRAIFKLYGKHREVVRSFILMTTSSPFGACPYYMIFSRMPPYNIMERYFLH